MDPISALAYVGNLAVGDLAISKTKGIIYEWQCENLKHTLECSYKYLMKGHDHFDPNDPSQSEEFISMLDGVYGSERQKLAYLVSKSMSSGSEYGARIIGIILGETLNENMPLQYTHKIIINAANQLDNDEIYQFLIRFSRFPKMTDVHADFDKRDPYIQQSISNIIADRFNGLSITSASVTRIMHDGTGATQADSTSITEMFIRYAMAVLDFTSPKSSIPYLDVN